MILRLPQHPQQWLAHAARMLPSCCALCDAAQEDTVCTQCRHRYLEPAVRHRCRQCAIALTDTAAIVCGDCLQHVPAYDATVAAADYAPPVDQLVLALKFGGRLALAPLFAQLMRDAILNQRDERLQLPDLLICVPLSAERLTERGFNQALEIAKPLSRALGIALEPRLAFRIRHTQAQSQLPLQERRGNLRHAFSLAAGASERLRGRHIGVVDDVITTGATLDELATTLKRFGAARVTNLVFARTH
jgi:ComF family protein